MTIQPQDSLDTIEEQKKVRWYALRDLKRVNAKVRAYQMLEDKGFQVFTPMKVERGTVLGKRGLVEKPAIPDLLFVHSSAAALSPYISHDKRLIYRIVCGNKGKKVVVRDSEMELFMRAASSASQIDYYKPEEYDPSKIGEKIMIKGGAFDGEEGVLLSVNGTKKKNLVVRLANLFVAVVELKELQNI